MSTDISVENEAELIGAETIRGQRGSTLLKYNGFIYRITYRSSSKVHWQCDLYRHRLCRGILWTFPDGRCELRAGHNHPPLPLEQNNNEPVNERRPKISPENTIDGHPFPGKDSGVPRSLLDGSSSRSACFGEECGDQRKSWRHKATDEEDECGKIPMKRRVYRRSAPGSFKPRKRRRGRRRRMPWERDDESDDENDDLVGTIPSLEKWEPNEEYEVEAIRDIVRNPDGTLKLLVKWKNWPETTNSWEPFSNTKCYDAIVKFLVIRDDSKYMPSIIHEYVQEKFKSPESNIVTVCQLLETGFDLKRCLLLDYRERLRLREILRELKRRSLLHRIRKHFENPLRFVRTVDGQQNLRNALRDLQQKFCSEFTREPLVYFENVVDFDMTPLDFTAIEEYVYARGIVPLENEESCNCVDCSNCTCTITPDEDTKTNQNYTADGRLARHARKHRNFVFECGPRCSCSADCFNRVTQRGRPVEVTVFKTGKEKGWGLRPNSAIKAWTFVSEYLGVVKRPDSHVIDEDIPFIYELGVVGKEEPEYVIDSSDHGNVSRFINHSCHPNLVFVRVFNQHRDPAFPRLALFACRDIVENEELTIDYRSMKVSRASRSRGFGFKCFCQEANCCGEL